MPAQEEEVRAALDEGIEIQELVAPVHLVGSEGRLTTIRCQRMRQEAGDGADVRGRVAPINGGDFDLSADVLLVAIGEAPDPSFLPEGTSVELSAWGGLLVNPETLATGAPGVFAAGDITYGPKTVIHAAAHGRQAARAIHAYLQRLSPRAVSEMPEDEFETTSELPSDGYITLDLQPSPRARMPLRSGDAAHDRSVEYAEGFSEEAARREADRCLRCDLAYRCPTVRLVGHEGRARMAIAKQ